MRPTYVTLERGQGSGVLAAGDDATCLFSLTIPRGNRDCWAVSTSSSSLNSDSCDYIKDNCLGKAKSIIAVRRLTL